jgi:REP element-mobilizing transposase RayT
MPNHVHGIVWIGISRGAQTRASNELFPVVGATGRSPLRNELSHPSGPAPKSLGSFIAGYKSSTTKRINMLRKTPGKKVWMRNYFDRIIRDENELSEIRRYIIENPQKWEFDQENLEVCFRAK